jgi:hypothetical protein
VSALFPHEEVAFRTALKVLHKRVYEEYGIVPIPAICTGPQKHEWVDGGPNGAIRAPSLRNCVCFWCGKSLKPHPNYPKVVDAETQRKTQEDKTPKQAVLPLSLIEYRVVRNDPGKVTQRRETTALRVTS